jgi:hypothetical protein
MCCFCFQLRPWRLACLAALLIIGCGQVDVLGEIAAQDPPESPAGGAAGAAAAPPAPEPSGESADTDETATAVPICAAATTVFARALCACGSLASLGDLRSEYVQGTSAAGALGRADIGVAGELHTAAFTGPIAGDLTVAGAGMSVIVGALGTIEGALRVQGDLAVVGVTTVASDAWLRGRLLGDGVLVVEGDVHRGSAAPAPAGGPPVVATAVLEVGGQILAEDFTFESPCACEPEPVLDVAAVVARAAADHDNAAVGFSPATLADVADGQVYDLPAGRLFAGDRRHARSGAAATGLA